MRRSTLSTDDGYTLVELLVVMTLAIVVLGAVVSSFVSQLGSESFSVSRANKAQETVPGVNRMTAEIRSATHVVVSGGNVIDLQTPVRTGDGSSAIKRVVYDCSTAAKCTRDQGPAGLASTLDGHPSPVVQDLESTSGIFAPSAATFDSSSVAGSPYVSLTLNVLVDARSGRHIQFNDGVALRNVPMS